MKPLKIGRSDASESTPVGPVPEAYISAIKDHVASPVWALVQLQRLTGARGGELFKLRSIDIDTTGALWMARLHDHKTAHHGHKRTIVFGTRAQAVLKPFMSGRAVDATLFDPREGVRDRKAAVATKGKPRRPDQKQSPKRTKRTVGNSYSNASYRKAIQRACDLSDGNVPRWHPHQLRHNFATEVRKKHGVEAARVAVGHKSINVTEIYAERDLSVLETIAAEIG